MQEIQLYDEQRKLLDLIVQKYAIHLATPLKDRDDKSSLFLACGGTRSGKTLLGMIAAHTLDPVQPFSIDSITFSQARKLCLVACEIGIGNAQVGRYDLITGNLIRIVFVDDPFCRDTYKSVMSLIQDGIFVIAIGSDGPHFDDYLDHQIVLYDSPVPDLSALSGEPLKMFLRDFCAPDLEERRARRKMKQQASVG